MDMKQIKELMAAMEKAGLKKIRIKEEKGFEVELERHGEHAPTPHVRHHEPTHHFTPAPAATPHRPASEEEAPKEGSFVSSPMVGTFYASPSPDDPIYVKVGDEVDEETVVCIIEAMKVMNEVKAGKKGKIAEICVDSADPVEFGTHLFRIV
ncbi:MAG: Biotin carboxyl carrier protein of acetyl-CoA carboxylase [Chlamydiae bacterium]|nr:Biotin carboxyl carrier protein of acetyl-CoA carboxylase [Chlamydiota bacterium]